MSSAGFSSTGLSQRRHHGDEEAPAVLLPGATSQVDLLQRNEPSSSQAVQMAAKVPPEDDAAARAVALSGNSKDGRDGALDGTEEVKPEPYVEVTYLDIAKEFSILGYIAFGGPAAHIGLFQKVRMPGAGPWAGTNLHACGDMGGQPHAAQLTVLFHDSLTR